jgi:phenylacetate-coenzyme A ligase PaaK-like adenylate-forming protein
MNYFVHRHLLLPAFETAFKRRKTFRYWAELERTQRLSPQAVAELQFQALRRLIEHGYTNCPYYQRLWDSLGLHPRQLTNPADIARWPIIDREAVRASRVDMRSTLPRTQLISKSTGGSSGVPLRFDLDLDSNDRRTAAWHRGYAWAGAGPGTKQLYLWGVPLGDRSAAARLKDNLYHRLHRRLVVNSFDGDGDLAMRFATELERYRPDVIVAYTNPLHEVARHLEEMGPLAHRPAAIVVGAEKLHDFQRERIERVFRAPVFETYGSREFMLIGAECDRHRGLHLTAEHLLVEILDDDGRPTPDGQEGNIVITDLYNYGMPFIRYANGDRALAGFETCDCGRGLPLLKKVVGRRLDMLHATGGRALPGEFFPHLVKDFAAVRRFQVIQETPDRVRFTMVAPDLGADDRAKLQHLVRDALGSGVAVEFEQVEQIRQTPAGKLQVVINRIVPVGKAA